MGKIWLNQRVPTTSQSTSMSHYTALEPLPPQSHILYSQQPVWQFPILHSAIYNMTKYCQQCMNIFLRIGYQVNNTSRPYSQEPID